MKHALILPDGAADEPLDELDGQTPLQAAQAPNADWIAQTGRCGTVETVPEGLPAGSDVATLSVLGYDPLQYYTGRAPIEAAAQNLDIGPQDLVFRCNLTTITDEVMVDFSAGHISQVEAEQLIAELNHTLGDDRIQFHTGVMYRHLMVLKDAKHLDLTCTPPHDIPDQPIGDHQPKGHGADLVIDLMERSRALLAESEVNHARHAAGKLPATSIWLWGQGQMPYLPSFESLFELGGACITAVDLIRGLAVLVGWPVLEVEGATGYLDTNYEGKGQRAVEALSEFDLICVHVEAPDEAGHKGDAFAKIKSIEEIDEHIIGPLLEELRRSGQWKCLVLPDHPTPVAKRTHTTTPPPFCMAGSGIRPAGASSFCEKEARNGGLHIKPGYTLMPYFLGA